MPIKIVEADIEKDIDIFLELLNRNRKKTVDRNRFEWLYLNNPHGKARAWLVIDDKTDDAVASTCVLPRVVSVEGRKRLCWNCGDFSVDRKYRTLGVALKLRRKAKEAVDNNDIDALYAHPNDGMKLVHEKVGHLCIGEMHPYVKTLSVNSHIEKLIKTRKGAGFLSPFFDLALRFMDVTLLKTDKKYSVEYVRNKPFTEEYSDLYKKVSDHYRIIGDRSSGYLNWRYGENPLYDTERVAIRENGDLVGYVLFSIQNRMAVFRDILCMPDANILRSLVGGWIKLLRANNIESVKAVFMHKNPLINEFKKYGFRFRPETSKVFAYTRDDDDLRDLWCDGNNWYMTVGDRDV